MMKKALSLSILPVIAGFFLSGCMPHSTSATEVGVRTVKWSFTGQRGVEETVYPPGSTYFFVPFFYDWHTFDTRLMHLEMTAEAGRGERDGRDDLLFKTIDGNDISLDVIISYRIDPEKAPMVLQQVATTNEALRESIVRTVTRSRPRDIFGELDTEEFYTAEARTLKAQEAQEILNDILEPYGVIIERVGTRDYRFNPAYQAAIESRKVADQEAQKLRAETNAKEEEFRTLRQRAEAEVEKIRAQADGEYERAKIEADAYFEQQERIAQAVLIEGQAEAEAVRQMNRALSGPGGENMVKLALAEALSDKRIIMIPMGGGGLDVRSTNINELLQLYGIEKVVEQGRTGAQQAPPTLQRPAQQPGN
jgi:regulator of protease activity HflC (stomatin/prohibitin superfamily)